MKLKPGCIRKVNRLPTPIAGLVSKHIVCSVNLFLIVLGARLETTYTILYDTIEEIDVDSKAEYTA